MHKLFALAALAMAGAACVSPLAAETRQSGDFAIYASAFSADTLTPEVAQRIGLQRGKHRGILNVTVVKATPGSTVGSSAVAQVEARIVKPESQRAPIAMREIRDGEAISYMGEIALPQPMTLDFEIRVRPAGAAETQTIHMTQELFAD